MKCGGHRVGRKHLFSSRKRERELVETKAEQSARFGCVCEFGLKNELIHIEAGTEAISWQRVGIHRNNVLVTNCRRVVGTQLERFRYLAFVNSVK